MKPGTIRQWKLFGKRSALTGVPMGVAFYAFPTLQAVSVIIIIGFMIALFEYYPARQPMPFTISVALDWPAAL